MLIGILSDTHGKVETTTRAVRLLRAQGAQMLIHCGDIGGEGVLDELVGTPALVVWGNCDGNRAALARYAADLGIDCRGLWGELDVDGKRIAVTHGDDISLMQRLIAGGEYDYLLHGHTHVAADHVRGRTRIINPGALQRAAVKTVALLDPGPDALRRLVVSDKE